MATAETARLIASLELQDKNFTRGLKGVERGVTRVDKKLGAFSGAVNRNVGRAVDNITTRLLEVPGAVISAAVEQETAFTGIAKTIEGDITGITDELKKLSTETGSTVTELSGIAELGGAMGIAKEDIVAFTEQVAILGATTNVSVEDAATALGVLGNVIGLQGDEFDNFSASLVDLGNKGESTEAAILEVAKRSGGAAKLFGIAKDETLGWSAAVANLGLNEELAGTALQNLFVKSLPAFTQGNKTLQQVTGKTAKELKQAFEKDASGALQSFIGDLSKLSKGDRLRAIQKLYGKGSGLTRVLLGLTGDTDNLTDSLEIGTKAWEEATAAQEEADKRFGTSEFTFKRLNNAVTILSAGIGKELLPVLVDLAEEGIEFLTKPSTQKAIKNLAVGLGKGIRGLVSVLKGFDWGAVAGFLGTAAGFAGELVKWFQKMPDWAQAFLIGGFVATKLPIIGDLVSELGKGLIKGVLGMTAGVVNINAGVVNGGVPGVPGGKGGKGPLGLGLQGPGGLLLGLTGIGFAAMLASEFEDEIQGVATDIGKGWRSWLKTNVNIDIPTISPKDLEWPFGPKNTPTILPEIFGGNGLLGGTPGGVGRPAGQKTGARPRGSEMPQLSELTTALDKNTGALKRREAKPSKPLDKVDPLTMVGPLVKAGSEQKQELGLIKNGLVNLNTNTTTQTTATTAALSGVKTGVAAMDANQKAAIVAQTAVNVAGNVSAAFQAAGQLLATGTTTQAVNTGASATRGVAPPIVSTLLGVQSAITTAIWGARTVIQSTNVVNNYTQQQRTGASSGSRQAGWDPTH